MVSSAMEQGLIYSRKLSSVGPGHATVSDSTFEPGNMDLAMKLHYLKGIYYFGSRAFEGLTTLDIKEPMFEWLDHYPVTCGRLRRDESGRAYIKFNDCGVRFIEARCDKSLDEWLEMADAAAAVENLLCYDQVIGPELSFSPLVYIQLTKFKCGGSAVGLSWAHVLGDAFSTAEYLTMLGQTAAGSKPQKPINMAQKKPKTPNGLTKIVEDPISIKRVDPVGDYWVHVPSCKMETFSFNVSPTQLSHLKSRLIGNVGDCSPFEALSAVIWHCIARIRAEEIEPRVVTICKRSEQISTYGSLGNNQVISVVKADFPIVEANPSELARLVQNEALDESDYVDLVMKRDHGLSDFIIYGANLTFVNLEEAGFYDFDYRGEKPIKVSYKIEGVGEKGVILVLPGPKEDGKKGGGRLVTVMLPENEIIGLKSELEREGLMA
ncbi:hypothetical protein ACS0TY_023080 [Phlomoides rotata]